MDSALIGKLLLLAVLITVSAFFAASESSLFSLGLFRVRRLKQTAQKSYQAAQKLLTEPTKLISTILIGNELVNTAISVVGASVVYELLRDNELIPHHYLPLAAVAIVLPFILLFGEIIPKILGMKHAERFVSINAVPLLWFSKVTAPIRNTLVWLPENILKFFGQAGGPNRSISEDVFRSMVDVGREEGVLDAQEQKLIHNVFNLDDVRVASIMTPLLKVSCLKKNMTLAEVMRHLEVERYSRFPVLQPDGKGIAGVLYVKDLLASEPLKQTDTIHFFLRTPLTVVPTATALELFAQFRTRRTHFAIVAHPATQEMMGVVTLDDILEEVFGHLRDERDLEEGAPSTLSS